MLSLIAQAKDMHILIPIATAAFLWFLVREPTHETNPSYRPRHWSRQYVVDDADTRGHYGSNITPPSYRDTALTAFAIARVHISGCAQLLFQSPSTIRQRIFNISTNTGTTQTDSQSSLNLFIS